MKIEGTGQGNSVQARGTVTTNALRQLSYTYLNCIPGTARRLGERDEAKGGRKRADLSRIVLIGSSKNVGFNSYRDRNSLRVLSQGGDLT